MSNRIYTLLAKVGHKIEGDRQQQGQILYDEYFNPAINSYEMQRLSTVRDILQSGNGIEDIVMLKMKRPFSLDYDYKRKIVENSLTVPHKNLTDFFRYRAVVDNLRSKHHKRATPALVEVFQARAKQNVRNSGGNTKDCVKHFTRALIQEIYPFCKDYPRSVLLDRLRPYGVTQNHLKNARRKPFVGQIVFNTTKNRALIRKMLRALGYKTDDNYQAYLDLLMHPGLSNPIGMHLIK
jgi:hypothetical protein